VRENLFGHLAILDHMSLSLFGSIPDLASLSRRQSNTVFADEQETRESDMSGMHVWKGEKTSIVGAVISKNIWPTGRVIYRMHHTQSILEIERQYVLLIR
jgi:hypothetical protein